MKKGSGPPDHSPFFIVIGPAPRSGSGALAAWLAAPARPFGRLVAIVDRRRQRGRKPIGLDLLDGLGLGRAAAPANRLRGRIGIGFGRVEQDGLRSRRGLRDTLGTNRASTPRRAIVAFVGRHAVTFDPRLALDPGLALAALFRTIAAMITLTALTALATIGAGRAIGIGPFLAAFRRGGLVLMAGPLTLVAIILVGLMGEIVAARSGLLFLETRPAFAQHAEIMIGELQIIFGVDPIALHLGVAGQRLVLLEQLGGIAARTIVDAVAAILATVRTVRPRRTALTATTAATATVLPIIDQLSDVLVTGGIGSPLPTPGPSRIR